MFDIGVQRFFGSDKQRLFLSPWLHLSRSIIAGNDCPSTDCTNNKFYYLGSSSFSWADGSDHSLTMNDEVVHKEHDASDIVYYHRDKPGQELSFYVVSKSTLMKDFDYDGVLALGPGDDEYSPYKAFEKEFPDQVAAIDMWDFTV